MLYARSLFSVFVFSMTFRAPSLYSTRRYCGVYRCCYCYCHRECYYRAIRTAYAQQGYRVGGIFVVVTIVYPAVSPGPHQGRPDSAARAYETLPSCRVQGVSRIDSTTRTVVTTAVPIGKNARAIIRLSGRRRDYPRRLPEFSEDYSLARENRLPECGRKKSVSTYDGLRRP